MNRDYHPTKTNASAALKRMAVNLVAIAAVTTIFGAKAVEAQHERLAAGATTVAQIESIDSTLQ